MTDPELDRLLDTALAAYAGEPPARLAGRVMARVRRPRRWWAAGGGAVAVAAGLVLTLAWPEWPEPAPPRPIAAAIAPAPRLVARRPPPLRHVPEPLAAWREPPLTAEEERLLMVARTNPALLEQVFASAPKPMVVEPLRIEALSIEPLAAEPR